MSVDMCSFYPIAIKILFTEIIFHDDFLIFGTVLGRSTNKYVKYFFIKYKGHSKLIMYDQVQLYIIVHDYVRSGGKVLLKFR